MGTDQDYRIRTLKATSKLNILDLDQEMLK